MVVKKLKELKNLVLDVEKNVFLLNGESIESDVSCLTLEFKNGEWLLRIEKEEFYKATITNII